MAKKKAKRGELSEKEIERFRDAQRSVREAAKRKQRSKHRWWRFGKS
jgi:hypothetical protein